MPKPRLINEAMSLDAAIQARKDELAARIMPLVQEFTRETGLLVRSVEPGYDEITSMEDAIRGFIIISATVHTDVDVRGISNRKVGG